MRPILIYPHPILRKKAKEVREIDGRIARLAGEMAETMYRAPGIGLAAPQVGESLRLIVADISHPEGRPDLVILVNPVIAEAEGAVAMEEGCLSLPGVKAEVGRAARVLVRGYDLEGRPVELEAEGLLAVVLQHEIDHLEGRLFIDHLSPLKRDIIERRFRKLLRER